MTKEVKYLVNLSVSLADDCMVCMKYICCIVCTVCKILNIAYVADMQRNAKRFFNTLSLTTVKYCNSCSVVTKGM